MSRAVSGWGAAWERGGEGMCPGPMEDSHHHQEGEEGGDGKHTGRYARWQVGRSHSTANPTAAAPHRTPSHRTTPHRTAPHRTAPHHTTPHRRNGDVKRADGTGNKALGGIFFRQLKRLKAEAGLQAAAAAAVRRAPPPLLRAYQAEAVGKVCVSWRWPLTAPLQRAARAALASTAAGAVAGGGGGAAAASGGASGAAAGTAGQTNAAAAAVATAAAADLQRHYAALAAGWRGNWLVVSPTGSGKTRMIAEVIRWVRCASSRCGGCGGAVGARVYEIVCCA